MAGPRTVPVELGSSYTKNDWSQKLMTVSQLIDEHILNEVREERRNERNQLKPCMLIGLLTSCRRRVMHEKDT